jgi:hypothetical protein
MKHKCHRAGDSTHVGEWVPPDDMTAAIDNALPKIWKAPAPAVQMFPPLERAGRIVHESFKRMQTLPFPSTDIRGLAVEWTAARNAAVGIIDKEDEENVY